MRNFSQENKRRIKHMTKTLNPQWDQTVTYGHIHREELQHKKLEITVWDYDRFKANDFLGQVTIDLKSTEFLTFEKPSKHKNFLFFFSSQIRMSSMINIIGIDYNRFVLVKK